MANISKIKLPDNNTYNIKDLAAHASISSGTVHRAAAIPSGAVDNTSTSTAYTATIEGITELFDGVCVWLKNGVVTSASGYTININNLGAKPVYRSNAAATATTTQFNISYTILLIYNSTRVTGGCWDYVYGFDSDTTYSLPKLGCGYTTCSTAAATVAKVASLSSYTLTTGGLLAVKFTYDVPANATLNVNSKGAKSIYYKGSNITAGVIKGGDTVLFTYSTQYHVVAIDRWGDKQDALVVGTNLDATPTQNSNNPVTSGGVYTAIQALPTATTSANGLMSSTDKTKLDGIATGAEVNQNAFSKVAVSGQTTVEADAKTDTLTLAAGSNVTLTTDATNDKVTIASSDTKNTAGSTDTSSKIFLVGATSQAANPQTYSQDTAYVDTNGHVYSNSKQVVNLSDSQALTNKTYNGYTLGAACAKSVVTSVDTSASLPTSNAVKTFVEGKGYKTTDANVTQTITTDSNDYRVLLSKSANNDTETTTARKAAGFTYNPSTSNLTVTNINGATPMRTTDIKDFAYSLGGVNSITANADLNDYTTRGCYACNDSSLTITHKPSANLTSYAFRLYVQWDGNSSSSVQQIFDPYGQELRFARHYNSGSWSEWVLVDDDLNAIKDDIISNWGGAKNLATVTSGTFTAPSGTRYTTIPLSEGITGEVTVYFGNLTSDDTQGTTCAVVVSTPTTTLSTINMPRGSNVSATVTITDTATKILIYPAAGYSTSSGKTVTWSNLMVCSKAHWDTVQEYTAPAMNNVELTAAIRALQALLANQ